MNTFSVVNIKFTNESVSHFAMLLGLTVGQSVCYSLKQKKILQSCSFSVPLAEVEKKNHCKVLRFYFLSPVKSIIPLSFPFTKNCRSMINWQNFFVKCLKLNNNSNSSSPKFEKAKNDQKIYF